jgi:Tfp pilus assembly PilM family ATPase
MASSKKIGLYCGEEKLTLVELEKNTSLQVVSASMGAKTDSNLPFSSNLTEEIQITALLGKILQDYKIKGVDFCVSLPMKDIILRSFVIPRVNANEIQNVIKFEAKKYMPFDIQELSFVFHAVPFTENQVRHYQIIFMRCAKRCWSAMRGFLSS